MSQDTIIELLNRLSAAEAALQWQPVATAPESEHFLGWLYLPRNPPNSGHVIAKRSTDETEGKWWIDGRYYGGPGIPGEITHWMPLPPPPER